MILAILVGCAEEPPRAEGYTSLATECPYPEEPLVKDGSGVFTISWEDFVPCEDDARCPDTIYLVAVDEKVERLRRRLCRGSFDLSVGDVFYYGLPVDRDGAAEIEDPKLAGRSAYLEVLSKSGDGVGYALLDFSLPSEDTKLSLSEFMDPPG